MDVLIRGLGAASIRFHLVLLEARGWILCNSLICGGVRGEVPVQM